MACDRGRRSRQIGKEKGQRFVTKYTHYRTGKVMIAAEYGYKAWPLGKRRRSA